jgi:uncharacterized membrane protein
MNAAHVHLLLNHLPIIGILVGFIILVSGFVFTSALTRRIGNITLFFAAVFVYPSFNTGEGAEEVVENLPGVNEGLIEKHEELAEQMLNFVTILLPLLVVTFYAEWKQKGFLKYAQWAVLAISFIVIVYGKLVGTSGGEIRHTEIRTQQAGGGDTPSHINTESEGEEED